MNDVQTTTMKWSLAALVAAGPVMAGCYRDPTMSPSETSTLVCATSARLTSTEQAVRFDALGGYADSTFGYQWRFGDGEVVANDGVKTVWVVWHKPGLKTVTVSDGFATETCKSVTVVEP